ncbi:CAP domain-containing protein [Streptomyces sp. RB6PN23]|uniref:CAP domain-containing protein n=1 Tax=Streptomyces silvisoli TaxID=3034235 RepID=A0ABT5ZHA0_9ACTN|nr:CAP domain-containing protein [Streptomyces silvisoli]
MGRHRRTSAEPAPPVARPAPPPATQALRTAASPAPSHRPTPGRGREPRPNPPVRTGLLGAAAALAVGAVAVASGLVPVPGGAPGGYTLGAPDDAPGNLPRADGAPTTPVTGAVPTDRGSVPTSRDAGRGADPGGPVPVGSPGRSARPSPTAVPPRRGAGTPAASATPTAPPSTAAPDGTDGASGSDAPYGSIGQPSGPGAADRAVRQVLALVNQQRAAAGCVPLTEDPRLGTLAQDFSQDMAAHGFFGHTDQNGRSPWDRAASLGIANLGGENIARGQADAKAVMDSWMGNPEHRANILDCEYHTIGIGVDFTSSGPWWTQDFGF